MESACTKRDRYCSEPNCVLKFSWLFITLTYSQSFIYLVYWYIIKPDESSFCCFGIVLKYSDTSGFFNLKILKIKWRLLGVCMQQKKVKPLGEQRKSSMFWQNIRLKWNVFDISFEKGQNGCRWYGHSKIWKVKHLRSFNNEKNQMHYI